MRYPRSYSRWRGIGKESYSKGPAFFVNPFFTCFSRPIIATLRYENVHNGPAFVSPFVNAFGARGTVTHE